MALLRVNASPLTCPGRLFIQENAMRSACMKQSDGSVRDQACQGALMTISEQIDEIFVAYISRKGAKKKVAALIQALDASHVDVLLSKVESIGDPSDYANELETSVPVQQFFAFVDLISALILLIGGDAVEQTLARENAKSQYLPWVKKFVSDERFRSQVMQQIPASALK